ncbi:transcription factor [Clydaea vesicula]|uniref:Transcription factor n=1 Tax=Clydaea vesicula TaxID=447962 RepID=A0AAD5U4M8_9FUNG|nr:transcription factor [Clydaea vesicula]
MTSQAYAKLEGTGSWIYFITKLTIKIGRNSVNEKVDLDLGIQKTISRLHATISYNFLSRKWLLLVQGRNGLKVGNVQYKVSSNPIVLENGNTIEIGGIKFTFNLPTTPPTVNNSKNPTIRNSQPSSKQSPQNDPQKGNSPNTTDMLNVTESEELKDRLSKDSKVQLTISDSTDENGKQSSTIENSKSDFKNNSLANNITNSYLKPKISFVDLIKEAILNDKGKKLTLIGIFNYIRLQYPYYKYLEEVNKNILLVGDQDWKNSIKIILNKNSSFKKVNKNLERIYWAVNTSDNFIYDTLKRNLLEEEDVEHINDLKKIKYSASETSTATQYSEQVNAITKSSSALGSSKGKQIPTSSIESMFSKNDIHQKFFDPNFWSKEVSSPFISKELFQKELIDLTLKNNFPTNGNVLKKQPSSFVEKDIVTETLSENDSKNKADDFNNSNIVRKNNRGFSEKSQNIESAESSSVKKTDAVISSSSKMLPMEEVKVKASPTTNFSFNNRGRYNASNRSGSVVDLNKIIFHKNSNLIHLNEVKLKVPTPESIMKGFPVYFYEFKKLSNFNLISKDSVFHL